MNAEALPALTTTLLLPNNSQSRHKDLVYVRKSAVFVIVLLAHVGVFFAMLQIPKNITPNEIVEPITVSLLSTAPVLDVAPIKPLEQAKKVTLAKPKEKVIPQPVKPVEMPAELNLQETEPEQAEITQPEPASIIEDMAAPLVAQTTTPAETTAKAIEETIDPPKFGVAYLNNPAPVYPTLARRAGEHGRVLLKVLVSSKGEAETVEIEASSRSRRLDEAAVDAVKRWRFVPARKGGVALSAYVLVPIKFSLEK